MVRHLLVTNDFPPKFGGIQSYLYELWRRLDPDSLCVLTTPHRNTEPFDAAQPFKIVRDRNPVLVPHPALIRRINSLAERHGAELVVLDPLLPIGAVGPHLDLPYALVVHGAEVTVPAMVRPARKTMGRLLRGASAVIAAGSFSAAEAERVAGCELPVTNVPPGVDTTRFVVLDAERRRAVRARYGLGERAPVVASLSRLVPRKGMDVLIRASARLAPEFGELCVLIGGHGRERSRLEKLIATTRAPVRLVGRVPEDDLADFIGMADIFAMCCRNRWAGIEQEGFGIVFLEAASCGVPQVAGLSGGSADAVVAGDTGLVVGEPASVGAVTTALRSLLIDDELRRDLGVASRRRAVTDFDYDHLAARLDTALSQALVKSS